MKVSVFLLCLLAPYAAISQSIEEISYLIACERFDVAYDSLLKIKKSDPGNTYVYFELGETVLKSYINDPYSETKKITIAQATEFLRMGVKQDSLNPLNYIGLGIIELFRNSDSTKADYYFNKSLRLIPVKKKAINDLHILCYLKLATSELYSKSPRFYKSVAYIDKLEYLCPKLPDVYMAYGDILMAQLDASGAIMNYKKALYLKKAPLTNVLIAKIYMMSRNLNESRKYYEDALKIDSLFAPAYKGLGDLYYLAGYSKLAKDNYVKFLELTGNNIPAKISYLKSLYKSKDYDEAFHVAEEITNVDSSKIYIYRLAAYSGFDMNEPDYSKSLYYIKKLFARAGEDELIPKDYSYYGRILLKLDRDSSDIQEGVVMLEKAYLADTTDNNALEELIRNSYNKKLYNTAIKYLTIKINHIDSSIDNYKQLGKAYFYNNNNKNADSIFSLIVSKDTSNLEANTWMAFILNKEETGTCQGLAKPYYERILRLVNGDVKDHAKEIFEAMSYLGSYYLNSKNANYSKAIDYFNNITDIDKDNIQWCLKGYYSLAYIYAKQKLWAKAKENYEMVLKLKPNDPKATKGIEYLNYNMVMEELDEGNTN
jgi:tetratricopeptide (TPR) repeat protein